MNKASRILIVASFSAICFFGTYTAVSCSGLGVQNDEQADTVVSALPKTKRDEGVALAKALEKAKKDYEVASASGDEAQITAANDALNKAMEDFIDFLKRVAEETGLDWGALIGGLLGSMIPGVGPALSSAIVGLLGAKGMNMVLTPRGIELLYNAFLRFGEGVSNADIKKLQESIKLLVASTGATHSNSASKAAAKAAMKESGSNG